VLREQKRFADAVTAYRLLLQSRPGHAEAHFDLGNALKGMGDDAGAQASYAQALEIDPEYAEARWALAMSRLPMVARTRAELDASRAAFAAELDALERWCARAGRADGARGRHAAAVLPRLPGGNHRERSRATAPCARA
jgi:protein O-GlcNAc transferase